MQASIINVRRPTNHGLLFKPRRMGSFNVGVGLSTCAAAGDGEVVRRHSGGRLGLPREVEGPAVGRRHPPVFRLTGLAARATMSRLARTTSAPQPGNGPDL